MKIFSYLPDHILNIILLDFWIDYFRKNVIGSINEVKNNLQEISNFYFKNKKQITYSKITNTMKTQLSSKNLYLRTIHNISSFRMFFKNSFPIYGHDDSLPVWCNSIVTYFICLSPNERFNIYYNFKLSESMYDDI